LDNPIAETGLPGTVKVSVPHQADLRPASFRVAGVVSVPPVRNFGLDLLRAIAITLVVASHVASPLVGLGAYGVELFFVLSGFLIGGILIRSVASQGIFTRSDLFDFWVRRWFRTLPNYYWAILLQLIIIPPTVAIWSYLLFLQNFAWPMRFGVFFTPSWSLAIEEWFYLLFPLTFFLLSRNCIGSKSLLRRLLYSTAIFLVVPAILRFTQMRWLGYADPRMIVVSRLDAIMYGVLAAYVKATTSHWRRLVRLWPLGVVGLSGGLLMGIHTSLARSIAFTLTPMSFALIVPRFVEMRGTNGWSREVVQRISIWSYSIYLLHYALLGVIRNHVGYDRLSLAAKSLVTIGSLIVLVMISAVNYRFVEAPITKLRDKLKLSRKRAAERSMDPLDSEVAPSH
jgi:peptidoglycan/LPS O-acetylase OafA/YrhL